MTDATQNSSDVDRMHQAMHDTKGWRNFRNLFMYAPDGIKILLLSEVSLIQWRKFVLKMLLPFVDPPGFALVDFVG